MRLVRRRCSGSAQSCYRGWHGWLAAITAALALATVAPSSAALALNAPASTLHYAANANFSSGAQFDPGPYGYTLADVSSPSQLSALPSGVQALVFLGRCGGDTPGFEATVDSYQPASQVFGFYLMDEPNPSTCPPSNLSAESAYIYSHVPNAVTFISLRNLSPSANPSLAGYTPANSQVEYYGVSPYPCRSELAGCDYSMIDRFVTAAANAGIPSSAIVPIFQAFGGGGWVDDGDGSYQMPTATEASTIICRWQQLVPNPAFDYAYSWGPQLNDTALANAPSDVLSVFAAHNTGQLSC